MQIPTITFLYGALLVHLSLGLYGVYRRRTLRIPARELLQMAFGLAIPLLLLDHVKGTRVASELYGQVDRYARVVWSLWKPAQGPRQAAMLGGIGRPRPRRCVGIRPAAQRRDHIRQLIDGPRW